jgi:hypothetical protein
VAWTGVVLLRQLPVGRGSFAEAPLTQVANPYPESVMEVHFAPEQLERVAQIAAHTGTDTEHLLS